MREASWKFTYLVRLFKSLMGVVIRCGPRDTVTVLSHLDECVLFRGCFSISSCEAKISALCLPICWRCGDPVLLLQLCARDWCWSSHAGPAICCLHLLSMAVVMLFFTHISAISSHLTMVAQGLNVSLWVNIIHKGLCEPLVGRGWGRQGFATWMHLLLGAT